MLERRDGRGGGVVHVDPGLRPAVADDGEPAAAQRVDQRVAGCTGPIEESVPQCDPLDVGCAEHLALVRTHRGQMLLEAAPARRRERVGLGEHALTEVPVPVAEHHRLGEEPARPGPSGGLEQVRGALDAQPVRRSEVAVAGRHLLQCGQLRDDGVEPVAVQRPGERGPDEHVDLHRRGASGRQQLLAACRAVGGDDGVACRAEPAHQRQPDRP